MTAIKHKHLKALFSSKFLFNLFMMDLTKTAE